MSFDLARCRLILERTPAALATLLAGLPPAWTATNEGGDTWSPFDVVGHLIHGERTDWIPRARHLLEHGTAVPFEPFDRFAQLAANRGRTLPALLDELAAERARSLAALDELELTPALLARRGRHPALGEVTLAELLATWVVHDLGHIAQITRTMARQLGGDVGPWAEYLPVLGKCARG